MGAGTASLPKYDGVCVAFPELGSRRFPLVEVFGAPMSASDPNLLMVVGRDILQYLVMHYDGPNGAVAVEYAD